LGWGSSIGLPDQAEVTTGGALGVVLGDVEHPDLAVIAQEADLNQGIENGLGEVIDIRGADVMLRG
jgi:hypothetical protein